MFRDRAIEWTRCLFGREGKLTGRYVAVRQHQHMNLYEGVAHELFASVGTRMRGSLFVNVLNGFNRSADLAEYLMVRGGLQ